MLNSMSWFYSRWEDAHGAPLCLPTSETPGITEACAGLRAFQESPQKGPEEDSWPQNTRLMLLKKKQGRIPHPCGYRPGRSKTTSWLATGEVTSHSQHGEEVQCREPGGTSQALLSLF